ncbi:hypothetical protein HanIR_Chr10g0451851 [Helianthus annuus]|nr:hypothetical protein HanIR_Chr10g0451851 [Helianthus annuus]
MAEQPHPVREFHRNHNQIAFLDVNVRGGAEYADIIHFLRNSRIGFTISENIHLVQTYIDDFWRTARVVDDTIEATVSGSSIVITEAVVRAALRFGALDHGNTCYVRQIRERGVRSFGYADSFDKKEIYKAMFLGQWRFFFHVLMQCLSPRKSGTDTMGNDLVSGMIGLTYNQPYNFSLMIFQAFKHQIGLKANDKRLMILYPRFLCLIFRHLLLNLSFEGTLPAYALAPMPKRIFTDCAKVNESKRTDARPVTTSLCGVILQDNYNPEADLQWLNIREGIDQIFVGDTQEPVVVQPQVDLQQPPAVIPEPEPIQEPVISEPVVVTSLQEAVSVQVPVSTSLATGVAVETDDVILELDAALDACPSSRTVDKGKRPMEDVIVDELFDDMPSEKLYLRLVMKELQNRLPPPERRKLELFRAKVASLGPSSDWSIRLARWNDKASDLDSIVYSSSSDDDDEDRQRPVSDTVRVPVPFRAYKRQRVAVSDLQSSSPMVASVTVTSSSAPSDSRGLLNVELSIAPPSLSSSLPSPSFVEATSVVTSSQPVTPIMSSPIPVVPLFESLSSQTGTGNVFALSGSSSLPDDDLAGKFSFIETAKGKTIEYESLSVNSDILRSFVFSVEMPEEIFNPIRVPEEVSVAARRWFRVLPDDTQRKRYLSTKGEYSGQILSWDFDERHGLVMIKRTDGVQYFRPRAKDLQTLPARDLHHIAQLDLNNHTNVASIRGLIPHLVAESRESKWKLFKPAVGQGVKYLNKFTGKEEWKVVYPPSSCLRKIPMRTFDLNKFDKIGYWYLNGKTGEAVITEKNVAEEIAKILDPIWLANLREAHLKKLRRLPLKYNAEDRVLADQFIKVVQFCVKNKVWAGSSFSKRI